MARPDPKRILRDLGRRIAELRRAQGWTQEELAEHLEFSLKYAQRLERGSENLTVVSLVALASKLRVSVGALFDPPASRVVKRGRPSNQRVADP